MNELRKILNSCISILKTIRIDYNTSIGPKTTALISEVARLVPLLKNEQPFIAECLKQSLEKISFNGLINAYSFGDIRTALKILDSIYSSGNVNEFSNKRGKKIFISHSSKDRDIVEKFLDHILLLGIGLPTEDIFCTSIEDLAIKNGEDIRNHIHINIQNADFSIMLISDNYKKSEICLNEMGAVWAYSNNVRYYLLPNVNFDKIGWLCNTNQAEKLFNSIVLDSLKNELTSFYSLEDKGTTWSRQRETFLSTYQEFNVHLTEVKRSQESKLNNLTIFDTRFYVRAITEGEYQYQLDIRLRSDSNIVLKEAFIVNDNYFIGDISNRSKELRLITAIPRDSIDINTIKPSEYRNKVLTCIAEKGIRITDTKIASGEQISISCIGEFETIRECDGYDDLPINNWKLCLSYDIDSSISIPIKLSIAKYNTNGYFWHNQIEIYD